MTAKEKNHGISPSGIPWKLEPPTDEDLALVANIREYLSKVPDSELSAEWARRAARKPGAGRQKVLRPCPKCGHSFAARELRAHVPTCGRTSEARREGL
jgi:hypothetical protein